MKKKTFPKDEEQKLRETIKTLRAERRKLIKENKLLKAEIENIQKPIRKRVVQSPKDEVKSDPRDEIYKKFKEMKNEQCD